MELTNAKIRITSFKYALVSSLAVFLYITLFGLTVLGSVVLALAKLIAITFVTVYFVTNLGLRLLSHVELSGFQSVVMGILLGFVVIILASSLYYIANGFYEFSFLAFLTDFTPSIFLNGGFLVPIFGGIVAFRLSKGSQMGT